MIRTIGYSYTEYTYSPLVDPVKKHGFGRGTLEALDIITSHSTHPLRFMSWVGFFASVVNMMYALYVVVIALTKKNVAGMLTEKASFCLKPNGRVFTSRLASFCKVSRLSSCSVQRDRKSVV